MLSSDMYTADSSACATLQWFCETRFAKLTTTENHVGLEGMEP
jgi:hypothetical protein